MVKSVVKAKAFIYMDQAKDFIESAKENMRFGRFNVAAFDAIQSMINSNDALTIQLLGVRASMDHRECLSLHSDVVRLIGDASQKERLRDALEMRSRVGYMGEGISKRDAERVVRNAISFHEWTKLKLG